MVELVARRPENERTFVRQGRELHRLPSGLTGMIPTDLDALAESNLLSAEGKERLAAEVDIPPAPSGDDESIASFVSRRLGREAYEKLVEPLMTGIYGGDGEQLSLHATFPALRTLELEYGSVLRGLLAQPPTTGTHPPFLSLRGGMGVLVDALVRSLERTEIRSGRAVCSIHPAPGGWLRARAGRRRARSLPTLSSSPYRRSSSLISSLTLTPISRPRTARSRMRRQRSSRSPSARRTSRTRSTATDTSCRARKGTDVLACTWTSRKWAERAAESTTAHAGLRRSLRRPRRDSLHRCRAPGARSFGNRVDRDRCRADTDARPPLAPRYAPVRSRPREPARAHRGCTSRRTKISPSPAPRTEASGFPTASAPARMPPSPSPFPSRQPSDDPAQEPSYKLLQTLRIAGERGISG